MKKIIRNSSITGAAFLMATSAIGPGFLTQTTVFTQQLMASFGFVILISILLDIGAQLNIWRILVMSGEKAQVIANKVMPGLGYLLAFLILMGGLAFNIGNIGGCGLGLQVLLGLKPVYGACISCGIALLIFWMKEAGKAMDLFTKILGVLMIILTVFVAINAQPPILDAVQKSIVPTVIDAKAIVTLVGGTVGGYICFAGGHRLLDAGLKGASDLPAVSKSALTGILVTAIMRIILFLAALGVLAKGGMLEASNPAASVFNIAAGELGYRFFGIVMWCAAITSVVGAAYTSVSFIRSFHPLLEQYHRWLISIFIICATLVFSLVGNPVKVLVTVGALNGLILPIALAVMLIATKRKDIINNYQHPLWMEIAGWLVVIVMCIMSYLMIRNWLLPLLIVF